MQQKGEVSTTPPTKEDTENKYQSILEKWLRGDNYQLQDLPNMAIEEEINHYNIGMDLGYGTYIISPPTESFTSTITDMNVREMEVQNNQTGTPIPSSTDSTTETTLTITPDQMIFAGDGQWHPINATIDTVVNGNLEFYVIDLDNIHTVQDIVAILQLQKWEFRFAADNLSPEARNAISQGLLVKK